MPSWLYFARRTGMIGDQWEQELARFEGQFQSIARALMLLRLRHIEEAHVLLEETRSSIGFEARGRPSQHPSVCSVLERYYYGVLAYYSFCIGEFETAGRQLSSAHEAVVAALTQSEFLLLLAADCQEFCYHQARVAHRQHDKDKAAEWVRQAEGMAMNELPLCCTRDGCQVFFSDLKDFVAALEPLTAEEHRLAREFIDMETRMNFLRRFIHQLEAVS